MRYKQSYSVYQRKRKSGYVFYYRAYDEFGNRTIGRSTGQTSRTAARYYCDNLQKQGLLIPKKNTVSTFKAYTRDWFVWGKCPYINAKLKRGGTFSRTVADLRRTILTKQIWPKFGKYQLSQITPKIIESWMYKLLEDGKSGQTINTYWKVLRLILTEAYRLGEIEKNLCERVKPFIAKAKEKGIFSDKEIKKMFNLNTIETVWNGHKMLYAINLVAYKTGMRLGEILALKPENIHKDKISVKYSYDKTYGLKSTKSEKERNVLIEKDVYKLLLELKMQNGIQNDGFLFSLNRGEKPVYQSYVRKYFIVACKNIKIKDEQRKERSLSFHSWRHEFNTRLVESGLSGEVIREVTGHSDEAMTSHYSHVDMKKVEGLQEAMRGIV